MVRFTAGVTLVPAFYQGHKNNDVRIEQTRELKYAVHTGDVRDKPISLQRGALGKQTDDVASLDSSKQQRSASRLIETAER